jgi:hypothetical protein
MDVVIFPAVKKVMRILSAHGPFQIDTERYLERDPHPGGQDAFTARC